MPLSMLILSILNLYLCSFNGYIEWMFFDSFKEINRSRKERNSLLSKGMSNT